MDKRKQRLLRKRLTQAEQERFDFLRTVAILVLEHGGEVFVADDSVKALRPEQQLSSVYDAERNGWVLRVCN